MGLALSFIISALSVILGFALLDQYRINRRSYQLTWSIALFLASLTAGLWFMLEGFGVNHWVYRLWFFAGAMALPVALGCGMVLLVASKQVAYGILGFMLVGLMAGVSLTLSVGFETPEDCAAGLKGLECLNGAALTGVGFFPPAVFILSILLQLFALGAFIVGAAWATVALTLRETRLAVGLTAENMAPVGSAPLVSRADMTAFLKTIPSSLFTASKVLLTHRDFWNRDRLARRGAGATIMAVAAIIGGVGALLDYLGMAAANLWLFSLSMMVFYFGLVAMQDLFEESPLTTLNSTTRARN